MGSGSTVNPVPTTTSAHRWLQRCCKRLSSTVEGSNAPAAQLVRKVGQGAVVHQQRQVPPCQCKLREDPQRGWQRQETDPAKCGVSSGLKAHKKCTSAYQPKESIRSPAMTSNDQRTT